LLLLTAIGLSPGGSGYLTCIQNMKSVTTEFKPGGLHEKHVVAPCQGENRSPGHKTNHDTVPPCRPCCGHWALLPPHEKQPRHDNNHSLPSIAKFNNAWSCISTHLYAFVTKASKAFPLLILFIISVSYFIILHDTSVFNPIYLIIPKKCLIEF